LVLGTEAWRIVRTLRREQAKTLSQIKIGSGGASIIFRGEGDGQMQNAEMRLQTESPDDHWLAGLANTERDQRTLCVNGNLGDKTSVLFNQNQSNFVRAFRIPIRHDANWHFP
jgi:hypothetical protein